MDTINWPRTLFIIDLETTGLDPVTCGFLEVAVRHPATGSAACWRVQPRGLCQASAEALRVNGLTWASLQDSQRVSESDVLVLLMEWIRDRVADGPVSIVGRNPAFDRSFLEELGKREGGVLGALFCALFSRRIFDLHGAVQLLALGLGWPFDAERIDDLYKRLGQQPEAKPHTAEAGAKHAQDALELMLAEVMRRAAGAAEADTLRDLLAEANAALAEEKAKTAALWKDYEMALATIQRHERATHGAATVAEVH
jgi:DNA polymerase III epsilon subunit-like protein